MLDQLGLTPPATLSLTTLLVNLLLGALLTFTLSWHFVRFGRTYSNRLELAQVLPYIGMATILVISVVKSSLALSLGLVGALSIVRFRTPIKEPEELAYLFMAIAVGLGLGADQRTPTIVAFVVIMAAMLARSLLLRREGKRNLYLNVEVPRAAEGEQTDGEQQTIRHINRFLSEHVRVADMRRLDVRDEVIQATYYVDCRDSEALLGLVDDLTRTLPGAVLSFVEQRGIPDG